ncbi:hypothetical protein HMPREF1991_01096 [Hoylesella loescheii DSM 19665 = JCM 12249 = ATCC 15930]|uniref:Uncharacterized protein n=1 Tax=Hoylesella loescheii DSM 19665 = JCM 12249 = ATCC 15930 TaxID=1122985 RepID=A0A069QJE6_HOYLO|nr:hypothetical protein HMPREF1991_01096 [Hoylesella loescheii DSM 19665 = JCM 12249 = ATCC 15930]
MPTGQTMSCRIPPFPFANTPSQGLFTPPHFKGGLGKTPH